MISELWMDTPERDDTTSIRIGLFSETASAFMANLFETIGKKDEYRKVEVSTN